MNPTQIKNLYDIRGKTIKNIADSDECLAILFEDNTFIQIKSYSFGYFDHEPANHEVEEETLSQDLNEYFDDWRSPHWHLLYDEKTLKKYFDEGCRQQEAKRDEENEKNRRANYERLKKHYEK